MSGSVRLVSEFLGFCEVRFGFGYLSQFVVGNTPVVVGSGIFLVDLDHFVEVSNGVVELTFDVTVDSSSHDVGFVIIGV